MNKKTLALHVAYIGTAVAVLMAVAAAVAIRKNGVVATKPVVEKRTPIDKVRVKTAERKSGLEDPSGATAATAAIGIVCGRDKATADRYEVRNDALRSIARRRDLEKGDVDALLAYLRSADDAMRVERVAALKNDVMNLLRNQEPPVEGLAETLIAMIEGRPVAGFGRSGRAGVPPPAAVTDGTAILPARSRDTDGDGTPSLRNQDPPAEGLAETLIAMIEGRPVAGFGRSGRAGVPPPAAVTDGTAILPARSRDTDGDGTPSLPGNTIHPPVVIDYCIQHLGAMVNELGDATRVGVRGVLVRAAREKTKPYAGTALYSLAEDKRATREQEGALKRLTLALCKPGVNNVARIAAIQLAGQRGYSEALPVLRDTLSGEKRDAVLDTVCIGSIGLLGNADDIALIERFASDSRRAAAVDAAIKRIKGREESFRHD